MQSSPLDNSTLGQRCACMLSSPLDCTHGQITSGVACSNVPWAAHTVRKCRAWHDIIALGKHTQSEGVDHEMPSSPLDNTHGRIIFGVAYLHRLWISHTIRRRQALNDRMGLGQHKQPDYVGLHMPSSPLGITQGLIMLGVECPYRP